MKSSKSKQQRIREKLEQTGDPVCTCCEEPEKLERLKSTIGPFYQCKTTRKVYFITQLQNGDIHVIPITDEQARLLLGRHT